MIDQKLLQIASLVTQLKLELTEIAEGKGAGSQCIRDEMAAFESFEDSADSLALSARVLAMRFNRAAIASFNPFPTSILSPFSGQKWDPLTDDPDLK